MLRLTPTPKAPAVLDLGEMDSGSRICVPLFLENGITKTLELARVETSCSCVVLDGATRVFPTAEPATRARLTIDLAAIPEFTGDLAAELTGYDSAGRLVLICTILITVRDVERFSDEPPTAVPMTPDATGSMLFGTDRPINTIGPLRFGCLSCECDQVTTYDVLDAFPFLRMHVSEESTTASGATNVRKRELYLTDRETTQISGTQAIVRSTVDRSALSHSPLNAVGLRMSGTVNTSLAKFLEYPDLTRGQKRQIVNGIDTILLKLGPGIAAVTGAAGLEAEGYITLWLAPSYSYLPVRMEFSRYRPGYTDGIGPRDFLRHTYELGDFLAVPDRLRDEPMLFPHSGRFIGPGGERNWTVSALEINPVTTRDQFTPRIPSGAVLVRDGEVVHSVLYGGSAAYEKRVEDTVEQARKALGSPDPPPAATDSSNRMWRYVPVLAFGALAVTLVVLRWRKQHASH